MVRTLLSRLVLTVVIAAIWIAAPGSANAQQPAGSSKPATRTDGKVATGDSVSTADIQRAAEQLAIAVQAAVKRATEDPALKVAALKVATNAVTAAQVVITQQAETLQKVLDSLAKEIAMATEKQQSKPKSH